MESPHAEGMQIWSFYITCDLSQIFPWQPKYHNSLEKVMPIPWTILSLFVLSVSFMTPHIHDTPHSWHPHCKQSWSVFIVISQLNRLNIKICLYTFPCFSVTWKQGYFNLFGNLTDQHRQVCWWWSVSCVVWASLVAIRPPLRCPPNRLLVDDLSPGTMILVTHQTCCYL